MTIDTLRRRQRRAVVASLLLATGMAGAHDGGPGPSFDIRELAAHAELVFVGTVTAITYRSSEPVVLTDDAGAAVLDDDGHPVLRDGSETPHTFVTYRIARVLKGRTGSSEITLRFFGGLADEPWVEVDDQGNTVTAPMAVWSSLTPRFDVGDHDILFVEGNTDHDCPLVQCAEGRVRLLDTLGRGRPMAYNEEGQQFLRVRSPETRTIEVVPGLFESIPQVMTHTITEGLVVERVDAHDVDPQEEASTFVGPPRGRHFTARKLTRFLERLLGEADSTGPLAESADPESPFVARAALETAPPADEPPTGPPSVQERARTPAEIAEEEALIANGGNPVLPATLLR
ncbi:MAG TPA: hypothetical protein VED01_14250 [Burkholderiales bacterium]|nr:hypothetical protein [Burkholderiales bacterium]